MRWRKRGSRAGVAPDHRLMGLVERTGASARAAETLLDAVAVVLEDVATAAGWPAAHAWVASGDAAWVSSGLWFPDDAIGLGQLRRACVDAAPEPARGHLALALKLQATQWVPDLDGLDGTARHDAALAAGLRTALACPVYAHGRAVAVLEWYLADTEPPAPDVAHVLGHLSGVLSEVAERAVAVLAQRVPSSHLVTC